MERVLSKNVENVSNFTLSLSLDDFPEFQDKHHNLLEWSIML